MTPEQRAFEILYEEFGHGVTRELFRLMIADSGQRGRYLREFQASIARGVKKDRDAIAAEGKPS